MISGKEFKNFCKWNLCDRYEIKFDINNISEDDFIFTDTEHITFVSQIINKLNCKVNLIVHNSDSNFTEELFNLCKNANKVYAINSITDKVTRIPLGFGDATLNFIEKIESEKNKLIYCNFNINNNVDRQVCFNFFKDKEWVDKKLISLNSEGLLESLKDYYINLSVYKYCLCPRGAGIDTHRIYECLYYNVIPIVKRNELIDMYSTMPIFLIDNWDEITLELLNSKYEELYSNLINWKEKNQNWYKAEYWIN
jgi:hypothetical protein